MTDLNAAVHSKLSTALVSIACTVIVIMVLAGQALQISQLKELNAYTRAAIERNDAAIAANRAALARLAPRQAPSRPVRPMPTPKP